MISNINTDVHLFRMHVRLAKLFVFLFTIFILTMPRSRAGKRNMYHYSRSKNNLPFKAQTCVSSAVSSLSHCAFVAGVANAMTFFYNMDTFQCRWDCVFLFNDTCSTFCSTPWMSFETTWKRNAAFNKLPEVSSVYGNLHSSWGAHYATDGVWQIDPPFFHSDFEMTPWIVVDFKQISEISFIRVYNRGDYFGDRFHDVAVEVSNASVFIQRGFYKGPALTCQVVEIPCEYQTIAQKVRLTITEGQNNALNIPEVEIYVL